MEQDRSTSHHKLKAILESLNSNTARQVLKELDQPNPKVKKNLLYELITEISNLTDLDYIQKQIRDKDEIIQLQQKSFQNKKAYAQNLENQQNQHIELFLASMQQSYKDYSIIPELKQIQQNQDQDLEQFLNLQEQFEKQQKKLFEFEVKNINQMDAQANRVQDDREQQERIIQQIESVITLSEKFLIQGNDFQKSSIFNKFEKYVQDRIIKLLQIVEYFKSNLKQLKKILSDQLIAQINYANTNDQLIKQIQQKNQEINNVNEANRVQKEKFEEQLNKMKQNLEKYADEKIKSIFQNKELLELMTQKFQKFQDRLKSQLYKFNQDIIKGIIEQQIYFLTIDLQTIRQSIQLGDAQKLIKQKVPTNITELLQQIDEMKKLQILQPAKEQLLSFGYFAKNLEDQINKFIL